MEKFKTLVNKLHVPAGTIVTFEMKKAINYTGKTGQLLCDIPSGGGLFYAKNELKAVK